MTKCDLTLTCIEDFNWGWGVYTIERSYPKVGVGQI